MKCDLEILLHGYIDNQLSQEQKVCVEKAIETDQNFRDKYDDFNIIKESIRELRSPVPNNCSWDQFDIDLWEKINDIDKKNSVSEVFSKKIAVAIAAVFFALFFLFFSGEKYSEETGFSLSYTPLMALPEKSELEHEPVKVIASIPKYKASDKIENINDANLNKSQIQFLEKEGFVVTQNVFDSFASVYQENQQKNVPSFVTLDMAISGFSQILGRLNTEMEREVLYEKICVFTEILGNQLIRLHKKVPSKYTNESLKVLSFVRVACVLLDLNFQWPQEILIQIDATVKKELELIYQGQEKPVEIINSPIFGYPMDYNRFRVHQKDHPNLIKYDLAHEWFARCIFRASESNLSETRSALLILIAAISTDGMAVWEEIHYVLTALYGKVDDPHLLDYLLIAREIYGSSISIDVLSDEKKLIQFCNAISRVRLPKIRSELGLQSGLRIFARRGIGCDFVLQQLTYPYVGERNLPRVDPSLLDIAVIMGYHKARDIASKKGYFRYKGYDAQVQKYEDRLKKELDPANFPWTKGGLISIAWMYESLQQPEGKGSPFFSHSNAWQARKLTSITCGLLDLYNGDPIFSGVGDGYFYGTVDPYPEFFNRMATKIRHFEEVLQNIGYPLNIGVGNELVKYRDSLKKLSIVSSKMLQGQELSKQDFDMLRDFALGWQGFHSGAIQDISTMYYRNSWNFDNHLYVGTGSVYELWVVIPINGKLKLARGGVFGFYEFQSMKQLSPEKWQELSPKPGQASWIKEYKQ